MSKFSFSSDLISKDLAWLKDIKSKILDFINTLAVSEFSFIKYSLSGDLYGYRVKWGLAQYVFAVKILYMLDELNNLEQLKKNNLITGIKNFEKSNGYISDDLIIKLSQKRIKIQRFFLVKKSLLDFEIEKIKRAETRQSFAALYLLNSTPKNPFFNIPYSKEEINKFLNSLDWSKPWDAGSHFSHLLFFLKLNQILFNYKAELADNLINFANSWVDNIQSKSDGFWYKGNVSNKEKINGAMKVLTGKSAAGIFNIKLHEKIIDICLNSLNDDEACSNFNIVYCLYYCSNISDYRKEDIKKFCFERLKIYKQYYFENIGGFSFYKNKTNDYYYSAKITKGLNEPDIHGTVMFLWGITLISKILNIDFVNFNLPLT